MLLLLNLLLCSFLLLRSSCLICCSSHLAQATPLFLLNLLFHSSCSTYYSSYSICCSAPLTRPILLLLPNLLFHTSCSTCSAFLVQPLYLATSLLCLWFCCFLLLLFDCATLLLLFQIGISPHPFLFCRCGVWRSNPNSNFSNLNFLGQTWKVRIFVFNFCLLMSFFNYPCFWEMGLIMCFFLCTNYLNIVHLIIHIAFHLHNFIMYFLSTLQIFFFQFFVNV